MLYAGHHKAGPGQGAELGQVQPHVLLHPGGALHKHHQGIPQGGGHPRTQTGWEQHLQMKGAFLPPHVLHMGHIGHLVCLAPVRQQGVHPRQNGGVARHHFLVLNHHKFLLTGIFEFIYYTIPQKAPQPWSHSFPHFGHFCEFFRDKRLLS